MHRIPISAEFTRLLRHKLQNEIIKYVLEQDIQKAQKGGEQNGNADYDEGEADGVLARRPIDMVQFRFRLAEVIFDSFKHKRGFLKAPEGLSINDIRAV